MGDKFYFGEDDDEYELLAGQIYYRFKCEKCGYEDPDLILSPGANGGTDVPAGVMFHDRYFCAECKKEYHFGILISITMEAA